MWQRRLTYGRHYWPRCLMIAGQLASIGDCDDGVMEAPVHTLGNLGALVGAWSPEGWEIGSDADNAASWSRHA
eukprot:scaffold185347_cov45-Prasinocladus_malaysianus.AAC.2